MGCCHKLCPFTSNSHKASLSEKLIDISRPEEDYWSSKVTFDDFQPIAVLGRGSYGKVILVRKKNEDKLYAMKILSKAEMAGLRPGLRSIFKSLKPHQLAQSLKR